MPRHIPEGACQHCALRSQVEATGLDTAGADRVIALAGNPNTGKSTVFNSLTGLRQHTGNWPGKTVTRAEGGFEYGGLRYKLVDLPGTYSLLSASQDEEIARDFILFGQPDCTIVVNDATCLERNLNLVFQVLEITSKVVVAVNLMDEARRKGIRIDAALLQEELGAPVIPLIARTGQGIPELLAAVAGVVDGTVRVEPRLPDPPAELARAVEELTAMVEEIAPGLPNARWIAYRLLDGDYRVRQALESGELKDLYRKQASPAERVGPRIALGGNQ